MELKRKFYRIKQIVGPTGILPIGRSNFYERVASGEFPQPVKVGRCSLWPAEKIDAICDRLKDSTGGGRPLLNPTLPSQAARDSEK